jgi:hypothetical protein
MKKQFVFLLTALTAAFTMPLSGQNNHDEMTKTDMKKHDMSSMMGKATVDVTVEGLHMKVWLMTQKEHKTMMNGKTGQMMMDHDMKGMKHEGMGTKDTSMSMNKDMKGMNHDDMRMDKATKEAMMSGTHHIMLDVTDAASGKEIATASAKVLIVSPSKKNSSVDLKSMMNHLGDGLTLEEKGQYQFTVAVTVGGVSKTTQFSYIVK